MENPLQSLGDSGIIRPVLQCTRFLKKIFKLGTAWRGAVVQLVRMLACHAGGRGFESRPLRHFIKQFARNNQANLVGSKGSKSKIFHRFLIIPELPFLYLKTSHPYAMPK